MAVEGHNRASNRGVPYADAAVIVANGEHISLGAALGNGRYLGAASVVAPPRQELALLDVPGQHLLVRGDDGMACAGRAGLGSGRPDEVAGVGRDETEGL